MPLKTKLFSQRLYQEDPNYITQSVHFRDNKMKSLQLSFLGSPQKFGKAAYCDLMYTQSKLYDNVLFKDLISLKDIWKYKSQLMTLQALYSHSSDFLKVKMQQKQCIISTQQQQITFLRTQYHQLTQKNLQRMKKLLKSHEIQIQKLILQKQQQVQVIQSEKQILQQRIQQLQKQLSKNTQLVNSIEYERQQMGIKDRRNEQLTTKQETLIKQLETQIDRLEKQNRAITAQLNEEKLEIELRLKKQLIEVRQENKHSIQDIHKTYKDEIEQIHELKLRQCLQTKEILNKTIDRYEALLSEIKPKNTHLQQLLETLQKQMQLEKQRNQSLLGDIQKQDDVLDRYEQYLKQADQNIINLQQKLSESQFQLQEAKHILEKNLIEKQSFYNRIKITQQEAKKWRQSYYLNKSRIPDIIEN